MQPIFNYSSNKKEEVKNKENRKFLYRDQKWSIEIEIWDGK